MKRFFCLVLSLALLLSVLPVGAHAEDAFRFTRENFPRMDGSTSLVPLGTGITSVLLGLSREEAGARVSFNRTTQSFRNLANGYCDIVIAAEPKGQVFDEMEQQSFRYEIEQIAKEALVFVVNENNPVNSLTTQQVQDIYSGKITNWAEVGGEDLPIEAFQRNATSGSQVMMEKLVMDGIPMMEVPTTMVPGEMAQLIEAVKTYDNSASAIGYTVYYYAADMQMASGLKILQIDGITPCAPTLQDESYPFINGYYACISADAPRDSSQRILYDWLLSDAGQRLLELEGYVPVYAAGEAPQSGSNVAADYTNYTPNGGQSALFTEFDCPHDHFEPRSDYGNIYPYCGAPLYADYEYEGSEYDFALSRPMGFYTHKGELVTDPIFTSIVRFSADGSDGEDYFWVVIGEDGSTGYIAKDGSYASGLCYLEFYSIGDKLLAIRNEQQTEFDLFDSELNLLKTQEDFSFDGKVYLPVETYGSLTVCMDTAAYPQGENPRHILLNGNGDILAESGNYLGLDSNGLVCFYDSNWNATLYFSDLTPLIDPALGDYSFTYLCDRFYRIMTDSRDFIVDRSGVDFEWDYDEAGYCTGDAFRVVRGDTCKIYSDQGRLLYDDIPVDWEYQGEGIFIENSRDGGVTIHRAADHLSRGFPDASYGYRVGKIIYIVNPEAESTAVDLELNVLDSRFSNSYCCTDAFTGTPYIVCNSPYGFYGETILMRDDFQTELLRINGNPDLQDGHVTVTDDWAFRCYRLDGTLIFCYPYYGMGGSD